MPNAIPGDPGATKRESDRLALRLRARYGLTPCEAQVARYVADGLRYAEIAESLGVSYHTVHSHVKAIHSKVGIRSNGRLMALIQKDIRP